ncbi:MAG: ABC transporter ATP-binding protein [Deltaproteobacteria bacterium]|nr:ABC transporter ATP-binding protein [Deltaproteobacteria bacterium]
MTATHNESQPVLAAEGLCLAYGARTVLEDISFALHRGEALGLLGPNGSGKSTLLGLAAGLLSAQRGVLRFRGEPWPSRSRALRSTLGVAFQSPSLDPKLTARQNLMLAARLYGIRGAEAHRRTLEQLLLAGLHERADEPVAVFSGGMRRRLDLARAVLHRPRLLLLDEPTAGLDESAFRATWKLVQAMRTSRELSLLLATHRPEEAEQCDRLLVLCRGQLRALDTPENLRRQIGRDVVSVQAAEPRTLALEVKDRLGLASLITHDGLLIEHDAGHELIPRLVEAFPAGRFSTVSLRRPSLADVFLKLTGQSLDDEPTQEEATAA